MDRAPERPEFRRWVDSQSDPGWPLLPLMHITKGLLAEDVIRSGELSPVYCNALKRPLAYLFYGRPAYRVHGDGVIKFSAACPFCFVFSPDLIESADRIYAFDSGAFIARLYSHAMMEEMNLDDFSLESRTDRPNKLISAAFRSREDYIKGDRRGVKYPEEGAEDWEFHAQAYLQLLSSRGRNEPDDRISAMEMTVSAPIKLSDFLKGLIVPHTVWGEVKRAPWLSSLGNAGVEIRPYEFIPGRHPDTYTDLIAAESRDMLRAWGYL